MDYDTLLKTVGVLFIAFSVIFTLWSVWDAGRE